MLCNGSSGRDIDSRAASRFDEHIIIRHHLTLLCSVITCGVRYATTPSSTRTGRSSKLQRLDEVRDDAAH